MKYKKIIYYRLIRFFHLELNEYNSEHKAIAMISLAESFYLLTGLNIFYHLNSIENEDVYWLVSMVCIGVLLTINFYSFNEDETDKEHYLKLYESYSLLKLRLNGWLVALFFCCGLILWILTI